MLHKGQTIGAFDQQTTHVGHVENTAAATGCQVLGNDAGGVLDGHFPATKVHHLTACSQVSLIQLSTLQFTHFNLLLKC